MDRQAFAMLLALAAASAVAAGTDWVKFTDETSRRLAADADVGALDLGGKDYAWDDVDKDGDIDLVVVRKQPFTSRGGRRNVLLINVDDVLTGLTEQYISGFLEHTNDRDVVLIDVNGVQTPSCNGALLRTFQIDTGPWVPGLCGRARQSMLSQDPCLANVVGDRWTQLVDGVLSSPHAIVRRGHGQD